MIKKILLYLGHCVKYAQFAQFLSEAKVFVEGKTQKKKETSLIAHCIETQKKVLIEQTEQSNKEQKQLIKMSLIESENVYFFIPNLIGELSIQN